VAYISLVPPKVSSRQGKPAQRARAPTQREFEFMKTMPLQLSPAAAKREYEALQKAVGGERDRRGRYEKE